MATNNTASIKSPSKNAAASAAPVVSRTKKARAAPIITSITAHDLGLKIGIRYSETKNLVGFLPIIGWATVGNYLEAGTLALTPVIKGPANQPILASVSNVKGFVGLFPIEALVSDIVAGPNEDRPV